MDAKHTPGPWAYRKSDYYASFEVFPTRGGPPDIGEWSEVALVSDQFNDDNPGVEEEANARLIAAAPEMLVALEKWISVLSGIEDYNMLPSEVETRKATIAAIAKATGSDAALSAAKE